MGFWLPVHTPRVATPASQRGAPGGPGQVAPPERAGSKAGQQLQRPFCPCYWTSSHQASPRRRAEGWGRGAGRECHLLVGSLTMCCHLEPLKLIQSFPHGFPSGTLARSFGNVMSSFYVSLLLCPPPFSGAAPAVSPVNQADSGPNSLAPQLLAKGGPVTKRGQAYPLFLSR